MFVSKRPYAWVKICFNTSRLLAVSEVHYTVTCRESKALNFNPVSSFTECISWFCECLCTCRAESKFRAVLVTPNYVTKTQCNMVDRKSVSTTLSSTEWNGSGIYVWLKEKNKIHDRGLFHFIILALSSEDQQCTKSLTQDIRFLTQHHHCLW